MKELIGSLQRDMGFRYTYYEQVGFDKRCEIYHSRQGIIKFKAIVFSIASVLMTLYASWKVSAYV